MAKTNRELQDLEIFEIEVLDYLNSIRALEQLYFGGGTMLRLCHNLNRYSTDLDFWLKAGANSKKVFDLMKSSFSKKYEIIDSANKHYIFLFQLKSSYSKRSLKIEIRKKSEVDFEWERKIAFSNFTTKQVQVLGLSLNQMMKNKIEALISRKLIRDCFDIDFLVKRGIELPNDKRKLEKVLAVIESFKDRDFKVTLGSILDAKDREFFNTYRFDFLKREIIAQLNTL